MSSITDFDKRIVEYMGDAVIIRNPPPDKEGWDKIAHPPFVKSFLDSILFMYPSSPNDDDQSPKTMSDR